MRYLGFLLVGVGICFTAGAMTVARDEGVAPFVASRMVSTPVPDVLKDEERGMTPNIALWQGSLSTAANGKAEANDEAESKDTVVLLRASPPPAQDIVRPHTCFTTPMIEAVKANDRTELLALLSANYQEANTPDCHHATPLYYAVLHGRFACLKILLLALADPNIADEEGLTPLHLAMYCYWKFRDIEGARLQFEEVIEWLVFCGADASLCAKNGCTPWAYLGSDDKAYIRDVVAQAKNHRRGRGK
jgi:hypothetical protein